MSLHHGNTHHLLLSPTAVVCGPLVPQPALLVFNAASLTELADTPIQREGPSSTMWFFPPRITGLQTLTSGVYPGPGHYCDLATLRIQFKPPRSDYHYPRSCPQARPPLLGIPDSQLRQPAATSDRHLKQNLSDSELLVPSAPANQLLLSAGRLGPESSSTLSQSTYLVCW